MSERDFNPDVRQTRRITGLEDEAGREPVWQIAGESLSYRAVTTR